LPKVYSIQLQNNNRRAARKIQRLAFKILFLSFANEKFFGRYAMVRAKLICLLVAGTISIPTLCRASKFYPSGSADIDQARRETPTTSTDATNHRQRSLLLVLWLGALQQQGADTRPFFEIDKAFYQLEAVLANKRSQPELTKLCRLVDRGYEVAEEIQTSLIEKGPMIEAFESKTNNVSSKGDMNADWPTFQANIHNTGYTPAPGPRFGRAAWKFPVGLGWYCRPVVDRGRVYVASPGLRSIAFCLDLESGEEIWKATQEHPLLGIYKYPVIASTPLLLDDEIVVRELNSHGGNAGQAKHLVYIDKKTGEIKSRTFAGHVDYRTQYAPVVSDGTYVVYPFGIHDIYGSPAVCQNFNRLICANRANDQTLWDFNVGDIDALAEPVIIADRVLQGTTEGYLYCLSITAPGNDQRVVWKFKANGAVNSAVAIDDGKAFFGCNGGWVYCVDVTTGRLHWKSELSPAQSGVRKHFTKPTIDAGRIYVGATNKRLYCLDPTDGAILWEYKASDWIRSRPLSGGRNVFVATVDGKLHSVHKNGQSNWIKSISPHPIYADLTYGDGKLLISDSNLYLYCLSPAGELIWTKSLLSAFVTKASERIFTDQLSGGTYYQSKPTAHRGNIYFGTPAGFLHAVDARSGKELWKFEMGGAISVGPACDDGKIYAGQQGGERFFYCIDAQNGSLIWKQTIPGGWVWGSAKVDEGLVYVPTVNGYAVCLDGKTGHIVWMFPTAMSVPAEPAIDGDSVYFGSWSRSIYAFDKKNGEVVWKQNGVGLDSGTLIAYQGRIYVPHHKNIFMALDAKGGDIVCEGNLNEAEKGNYSNFNATPAFHNGRGFFSARVGIGLRGVPLSSTVYSVDVDTGKIIWSFPDGGGLSAPAIANGRVYIGSGNTPFFYCLDEETGAPYWVYKLGHRVEEATLCIYRDRVYALAADGYLHAIE
jgi:outer membrane protein assembly factor BamB